MTHIEKLSMDILIEVIQKCYGYDFHSYSKASLRRRFEHHKEKKNFESMADMIPPLLKDPKYFGELLLDLSVTVTELFRDPIFYKSFSENVIPKLKTYSYLKIWHAGCATGEEMYSMAILLKEHELLERVMLYGTDFNPHSLAIAKKGIYPSEYVNAYERNYKESGGKSELVDYFSEKYESIKIKSALQKNMVFSLHNLATDRRFNEVEVVVCRNVMIYFDETLKKRIINLFKESLVDYGFLCLGDKEKLSHPGFKCIDHAASIYQKVPE